MVEAQVRAGLDPQTKPQYGGITADKQSSRNSGNACHGRADRPVSGHFWRVGGGPGARYRVLLHDGQGRALSEGHERRLVIPVDGAVPRLMMLTGIDSIIPCYSSQAEALSRSVTTI